MDQVNLVGKTLAGRYELGALLGQGGMGTVYRATDSQMSERVVAVKVLAPHLVSDEKQVIRFEQEARAANQLRHPNTISVLDFGRDPAGHIFMVIEFLTGEDLTAILRRGRVDVERALYIMRQVCKSLAEAHSKGIVHRDLKPDNIFVCEIYGEKDFVKVIDFGIAKFLEDENANLTQAGKMFGTPRYLSPEQAQGKRLDNRSDLYSLGVILFECVTGRPPFTADEPIAVAIKHVQEEPPALDEVAPDIVVPEAVDALIFKLLQKRPENRHQNAEAVVMSIDEAMLGLQGATRAGNYTPAAAMTPARPSTIPPASEEATRAMESISTDDSEPEKTVAIDHVGDVPVPATEAEATVAMDTGAARAAAVASEATVALDTLDAATVLRPPSPAARPAPPPPQAPPQESGSNQTLIVLLILAVLAVGAVVAVAMQNGGGESTPKTAIAAVPKAPEPKVDHERIRKEAAEAARKAIEAERKKAAAEDARKKAAEKHKVVIESTPPGARIFFNNMELGTTPYEKQLTVKDPDAVYVVKLDGYEDLELKFEPKVLVANRIPKITAPLKKKAAPKPKPKPKPKKKKNDDPFGGID